MKQTSVASNFNGNPNGPGDYSSSAPLTGFGVLPFFSRHPLPTTSDFDVFSVWIQ